MRLGELFQGIAMGLMDGLITLLGIIVGVGVATADARLVIISSLVGGISNSFGTSIGFYTSENAERGQQIEFHKKNKNQKGRRYNHSHSEIMASTLLSFAAGVFAIVLPILPFFFLVDLIMSIISSLIISAVMLFILGYYIGKINETDRVRSGFKYVVLGIASAVVSFVLGEILRHILIEGQVGFL
jgi:predicted membrane protein (TIGR00267 family)